MMIKYTLSIKKIRDLKKDSFFATGIDRIQKMRGTSIYFQINGFLA